MIRVVPSGLTPGFKLYMGDESAPINIGDGLEGDYLAELGVVDHWAGRAIQGFKLLIFNRPALIVEPVAFLTSSENITSLFEQVTVGDRLKLGTLLYTVRHHRWYYPVINGWRPGLFGPVKA